MLVVGDHRDNIGREDFAGFDRLPIVLLVKFALNLHDNGAEFFSGVVIIDIVSAAHRNAPFWQAPVAAAKQSDLDLLEHLNVVDDEPLPMGGRSLDSSKIS